MTRRKGERTARQNERDFPFIVELAMPPGGLGRNLDLIHQFHRERGIEIRRGLYQRRDDQDFVRWCFANRADAEEFSKAFGGKRIYKQPLTRARFHMPTKHQLLGERGELRVVKACSCPRCKRSKTLRRPPTNFKCADVICDFCGLPGQVKTITSTDITNIPPSILGAAWNIQKARLARMRVARVGKASCIYWKK